MQTRKRKLSTNSFVESFGDLDQRNGSDDDELTEYDPRMDDEEYDDEDDNNVNDSDNAGVDDVKFIRKGTNTLFHIVIESKIYK